MYDLSSNIRCLDIYDNASSDLLEYIRSNTATPKNAVTRSTLTLQISYRRDLHCEFIVINV